MTTTVRLSCGLEIETVAGETAVIELAAAVAEGGTAGQAGRTLPRGFMAVYDIAGTAHYVQASQITAVSQVVEEELPVIEVADATLA